jgi:hypothetical protein
VGKQKRERRERNMDKGKLLASASGKGHKSIATWWIIELISVVIIVLLYFFANSQIMNGQLMIKEQISKSNSGNLRFIPSLQEKRRNELNNAYNEVEFYSNVVKGSTVFIIVICFACGYTMHTRISRTNINIYEKCIEGSSVNWLKGTLTDFQLTYDQVTSVDIEEKKALIIHAANVNHRVYAMNAKEIRDVLLSQKNKEVV